MSKYLFPIICFLYISNAISQQLSNYEGSKWNFSFLMIPGDKKSVSTNYHASFFELKSDSSFVMGMSEAVESGTINKDSSLILKLYEYNSDEENQKFANSFSIHYCSKDYLILFQKEVSYTGFIKNYKGTGNLYYVYSKTNLGWDKEAKKIYKKLKKLKIIS